MLTKKKHAQSVNDLGEFEFEDFAELSSVSQVQQYRENLSQYYRLRKEYYDEKAAMAVKYNPMLGKEPPIDGQRPGAAIFSIEPLEYAYCEDLAAFYDFVISNHSELIFKDGEILIESEDTLNRFNQLWGEAVEYAQRIVMAREELSNVLSKRVNEID